MGEQRWWRGILCSLSFLVSPLGAFCGGSWIQRREPSRLDQGLVIVLPGIEGRSFLNVSLMAGLIDSGLPYATDVVDWTTGVKLLAIYHLRARKRNQRVAAQIAAEIVNYRREFPGRPVWLVGHSGGGAMACLVAERLPDDQKATGLILLAPALSRQFDYSPAMQRTERGIWNFHSIGDLWFLGVGTTVFGSCDGPRGLAAGCLGFLPAEQQTPVDSVAGNANAESTAAPRLTQIPYSLQMAQQFNLGGHFGCVHRVFIAETIAPIIAGDHGVAMNAAEA